MTFSEKQTHNVALTYATYETTQCIVKTLRLKIIQLAFRQEKNGSRYITRISKQICQDPHKADAICVKPLLRRLCASIDRYGV
jgi:hypothetical protein